MNRSITQLVAELADLLDEAAPGLDPAFVERARPIVDELETRTAADVLRGATVPRQAVRLERERAAFVEQALEKTAQQTQEKPHFD